MPELPEVETIVNGLEEVMKGEIIISIDCYYPGTVIYDDNITAKPLPAKALKLKRKGKYIIIYLENANALIVHLRMTGKFIYDQFPGEPLSYERARINLENNSVLHFIDIRTFGKIIICRQSDIDKYLPTLGLEPFSSDFTYQNLKDKIQGKKAPVKSVLLDQSIIAGLGNIYVCEILYRARINPLIPAGKLKQKDIVEIIQQTKQVLSEAILQGGTSISDYRKIDDKTGSFQNFLRVYKKECCPLLHEIKRIKQSGRSTYYCPICQKNKS